MGDEVGPTAIDRALATLGSAVVAGSGGALGVALGGVVGAGAGPALAVMSAATVQNLALAGLARRERQRVVLDGAVETSGSTADELLARAAEDPVRIELLVRVLQAAESTTVPEKIGALSTVLASGLSSDDRVDESMLLVSALAELEAPHVVILQLITQPGPAISGVGEVEWSREDLSRARPGYATVLPAVLGALDRYGLITWSSGLLGDNQTDQTVSLTALGQACLTLLGDRRDATESGAGVRSV